MQDQTVSWLRMNNRWQTKGKWLWLCFAWPSEEQSFLSLDGISTEILLDLKWTPDWIIQNSMLRQRINEFFEDCLTHSCVSFAGGNKIFVIIRKEQGIWFQIKTNFVIGQQSPTRVRAAYHRTPIPNIQQNNYTQFDNYFASQQISTWTHNQ